MREELRKVAPGTRLREGLDMILAARTGALVVIGDTAGVGELCNGGFLIDTPFTPQRLFELAKMDGAITLDDNAERILRANAHLVPDSTLPTVETGMRHRTAERVSRQTEALVISVSQRREVVNLYLRGRRLTLEDTEVLLAKANQALQTLQNYRTRLGEVLDRLTHLEFDDLVTLGDVAETVGALRDGAARLRRGRSLHRPAGHRRPARPDAVRRAHGRSRRAVPPAGARLRRGLLAPATPRPSSCACASCRSSGSWSPMPSLTNSASPPRTAPSSTCARAATGCSRRFRCCPPRSSAGSSSGSASLPVMVQASVTDLDDVDGVGTRRARAIANGLARIRAHTSV